MAGKLFFEFFLLGVSEMSVRHGSCDFSANSNGILLMTNGKYIFITKSSMVQVDTTSNGINIRTSNGDSHIGLNAADVEKTYLRLIKLWFDMSVDVDPVIS